MIATALGLWIYGSIFQSFTAGTAFGTILIVEILLIILGTLFGILSTGLIIIFSIIGIIVVGLWLGNIISGNRVTGGNG